MKPMGFMIFLANFRPFILCNVCVKVGVFSVMLAPNEEIIGQVHFVYHIQVGGENFRQNAGYENSNEWSLPMPASSEPGRLRRRKPFFDRR